MEASSWYNNICHQSISPRVSTCSMVAGAGVARRHNSHGQCVNNALLFTSEEKEHDQLH